jgi:hypothetical protein
VVPIEELAINGAQSIAGLFVCPFTLLDDHLLYHKLTGALLQNVLNETHL